MSSEEVKPPVPAQSMAYKFAKRVAVCTALVVAVKHLYPIIMVNLFFMFIFSGYCQMN